MSSQNIKVAINYLRISLQVCREVYWFWNVKFSCLLYIEDIGRHEIDVVSGQLDIRNPKRFDLEI